MEDNNKHFWESVIPPEEPVLGSWFVVFVNHRKEWQERILVLTDRAYYRVKPGGDWFSLSPHAKKYLLSDISNVKLQKVSVIENVDSTALPEDTSVIKRMCVSAGIVSVQREVIEYAVNVCTQDITKTYIKPRLNQHDPPSKEVLGDLVLKFVNALFSWEDGASISHLLREPPSLPPRPPRDPIRESMFVLRNSGIRKSTRKSDRLLEIVDGDDDRLDINGSSELVPHDTLFQIFLQTANYLESSWSLVYDVNRNGGSLTNFYHTLKKGNYKEIVILLKDEHQQVFGAYSAVGWYSTPGVYGSGQNFLFKVPFLPQDSPLTCVRVLFYKWQKDSGNHCYQMSTQNYIAMGSGGGGYGLWLDDELLNGVTEKSETYGNDLLAATNSFKVVGMEVWCKRE